MAGAGKFTELRSRLLFVLGALIVYRIGCFIPVPGVNPAAMLQLMEAQKGTIVDMFNMFSGGALSRFSLFALNVIPYISASIVMQLMVQVLPSLKAMQKEGESGRRKITQYSRVGAVGLAIFQAAGIAIALQGQGASNGIPVVYNPGPGFVMTAVIALTAGTMFLMWIGEQVTERGVGNGVSLIIFAGIVAGLPGAVINTLQQANSGDMQWITVFFLLAIVIGFTWFVVFVESGQRRITVNYARRQGGRSAYMNQSSFLPLKLNMSGVIPPIFASSIIMFPATASTWFGQSGSSTTVWLQKVSQMLSPGEPLYMVLYASLIAGFAFFYTALVFNSQETADNLKKSGALIPGIRPGKATADYVDGVLTRLTAAGALYLVLVCLLPDVMRS
ncbi:MAG: preprotein translocase subunit SecY, partial [Thermomonas sp.]